MQIFLVMFYGFQSVIKSNGLKIQWYHASFTSNDQRTWTFPISFTDVNSFTIVPTAWANSNDTPPLQYFMFQKESTGIKFMSLKAGEHDFIAIGY